MAVAQLVEPRVVVPVVAGSSPVRHPSRPWPACPPGRRSRPPGTPRGAEATLLSGAVHSHCPLRHRGLSAAPGTRGVPRRRSFGRDPRAAGLPGTLSPARPRSSEDRAGAFEAPRAGSIPAGAISSALAAAWYIHPVRRNVSRREFLALSGFGVAALAFPGRFARAAARAASAVPAGFAKFVTEPSLKPPTVTVTTLANPAPGHLFVASLTGPGQRGPMIFDNHGRVVWFRRLNKVAINFRRQIYGREARAHLVGGRDLEHRHRPGRRRDRRRRPTRRSRVCGRGTASRPTCTSSC